MKKLITLTCLLISICVPVFAWNEKAADISLNYLNHSVHSKVHSFLKTLYVDEFWIDTIKAKYKKNPRLIKTKEINKLALSCVQRNQQLLNIYKKDYFIPAYNEYKKIDSSISLEDWIHSVALSEVSEFYEFYTFTEINLEDCQKIYKYTK